MPRKDNEPLAHHDTDFQARRIRLAALAAKIAWLSPVGYYKRLNKK